MTTKLTKSTKTNQKEAPEMDDNVIQGAVFEDVHVRIFRTT